MRLSKSQAGTAHAPDTQADAANGEENVNVMGILDSVDVPIVVIGRDCNVARFNQAATAALGLAPSDVGSGLCEVQALLGATDLIKQCQQVIADGAPCRSEIHSGDRWFLVHIAPY